MVFSSMNYITRIVICIYWMNHITTITLGFVPTGSHIHVSRTKSLSLSTTSYDTTPPSSSPNKNRLSNESIIQQKQEQSNLINNEEATVVKNDRFMYYQEAEIKHARLAMLAVVGWPISEIYNHYITTELSSSSSSIWDSSQYTGMIQSISPVFYGCCLGVCAALNIYSTSSFRRRHHDHMMMIHPNDDTTTTTTTTTDTSKQIQMMEMNYGRIAMMAISQYMIQEYVILKQNTPNIMEMIDDTILLFQPIAI